MTAFHTVPSAENQGMGYILRTGIRMSYILGVSECQIAITKGRNGTREQNVFANMGLGESH